MADQTNQPTPSPHRIESTGGDQEPRVAGERDAEIARLKAELTNLGYRYEDALAELARERDRD